MSIALVALFASLGLSALPHDVTRTASAIILRDPFAGDTGIGAPVFALRESGAAVRFGNATLTPDGLIHVGLYDPLDPLLASTTEAVSLPGDARLLWLLASPSERQVLRDRTADLALALSRSAVEILRSPEFIADYRDRFLEVLQADLKDAWQTTRETGVWQELLRGYEPILRDTASRELRPLIERQFSGVPMRLLRANALGLIDPFRDREWDLRPVEDAIQAAIQEIRDRELAEKTANRLLDAPPTAKFLRVFLDVLASQLAHDPKLKDLVGEMVFDERFRRYFDDTISRVMDLGRIAPRLLVSLHGSTDLNGVAAFVIRTMVSSRNDRVVVLLSPRQRDELMAIDSPSVHPLIRVEPH